MCRVIGEIEQERNTAPDQQRAVLWRGFESSKRKPCDQWCRRQEQERGVFPQISGRKAGGDKARALALKAEPIVLQVPEQIGKKRQNRRGHGHVRQTCQQVRAAFGRGDQVGQQSEGQKGIGELRQAAKPDE